MVIASLLFGPIVVILYLWVQRVPPPSLPWTKDGRPAYPPGYRERMLDQGIDLDAVEDAEEEFRRMEAIDGD